MTRQRKCIQKSMPFHVDPSLLRFWADKASAHSTRVRVVVPDSDSDCHPLFVSSRDIHLGLPFFGVFLLGLNLFFGLVLLGLKLFFRLVLLGLNFFFSFYSSWLDSFFSLVLLGLNLFSSLVLLGLNFFFLVCIFSSWFEPFL